MPAVLSLRQGYRVVPIHILERCAFLTPWEASFFVTFGLRFFAGPTPPALSVGACTRLIDLVGGPYLLPSVPPAAGSFFSRTGTFYKGILPSKVRLFAFSVTFYHLRSFRTSFVPTNNNPHPPIISLPFFPLLVRLIVFATECALPRE